MERLYAMLGLPPTASIDQVKSAYRKLVLQLHPDKYPGDRQREEMFNAVTHAYQTLSDPEKLAAYVAGRSSSSHVSPIVEDEQRRAANGVFHAVASSLFGNDVDERRRIFAAQFLPTHSGALSTEEGPTVGGVAVRLVRNGCAMVAESAALCWQERHLAWSATQAEWRRVGFLCVAIVLAVML